MKQIISFLGVVFLFTLSLQAQIRLFLDEQEVGLPDGTSSAWVFPIAGIAEDAIEDLDDYGKERSDVKMKKVGDNLIIAEKVSMPAIASKRGDLLGYVYLKDQSYNMAMVFQLGYDISLNSADWSPEMENLRNYAKAFMAYHYEQEYTRRAKPQEKELKDLEKEKKQTENKIGNLNDKINNLGKKIGKETETAKIEAYETDIRTLEADVKQLMDNLPGLESSISQLRARIEQNLAESSVYLSTIGGL